VRGGSLLASLRRYSGKIQNSSVYFMSDPAPPWVWIAAAGPLMEAKPMKQPDFIAGMRQMSRREMVSLLVNAAWALPVTGVYESMSDPEAADVPTEQCFLVQGRPTFLVSGSIHYFRVPHRLWRDRLLRAKRTGLNCISTYIAVRLTLDS
jgi:Glycosyl hydrolases family 35